MNHLKKLLPFELPFEAERWLTLPAEMETALSREKMVRDSLRDPKRWVQWMKTARIETVSKKTRIYLEKLMKTRRKHRLNLLALELLARLHVGFLEILQGKNRIKVCDYFSM